MKQYIVEVQTGRRNYAGTDADVYIQLFGEKSTSVALYLDNDANNFEKGKKIYLTTSLQKMSAGLIKFEFSTITMEVARDGLLTMLR